MKGVILSFAIGGLRHISSLVSGAYTIGGFLGHLFFARFMDPSDSIFGLTSAYKVMQLA